MIGIGVAGCGAIALQRHLPEYRDNPYAKIVGVYDAVQERSEAVAKEYGDKAYDSYAAMLADQEIEAVSICSANRFHADMTVQALEAGKHVLCEKPMATTVADAKRMIEASERNGRNLMIGHNQRLNEIHIRAKQLLEDGAIGRPISYRTCFMHQGPETWSVDKGRNTWFFDKKVALFGCVCDLGIHKVDLIRWLLNDEIVEVTALLDALDKCDDKGIRIAVDDNAFCIFRMKSGVDGILVASWTHYAGEENSTVIYGSEGTMRLNDDPDYAIIIEKKNGEKINIDAGEMQTNENQTKSGIIDLFIDEIIQGKAPEIDGHEGLAALRTILACMESSEQKRSIVITTED